MLLAATGLAAFQFVPYFFAYLKYWGIEGIVGNRGSLPVLPQWAQRAKAAHQNMSENYPHFAVLVLLSIWLGGESSMTVVGAAMFFCSRLAYAVVYILGIKWIRSMVYSAGLVGEVLIFCGILQKMA